MARKGVTIAHFTIGKNGVARLIRNKKGGSMPLKDLSGKTVHDLDRGTFEELFCELCCEYKDCDRNDKKILGCKAFVDSGVWDAFYRKRHDG